MKIKKYLKILLILVTAGLIFQSCATILGGKKNTLVFTGENATEAEVYIDDELVGEAPGKIKIAKEKIQHGSILVIKADGFEEKEYMLLRKQNAAYTVVDLLLGGIPLVVDYTTGNIYRTNPRKFEYDLIKQE
jgi:hypothetical protein